MRTIRADRTLRLAVAVLAFGAPVLAQVPRPITVVSEVRDAIAAHDLAYAEALLTERRAAQGDTPDVIEAISWLARGAAADKQYDRADQYADKAQQLAEKALAGRPVDSDAHLATAIGAAIEVLAQDAVARGARGDAILGLERALATYGSSSLRKRIQKNINLITLEGHPAPALDRSEWIGAVPPPALADLKGKVVVLFFWAHWCPDCKIEGPLLAKMLERYQSQGLVIVAPTQRYGYVARGVKAGPDDELRYIVQVRDQYYGFLVQQPVPVTVANHERYGVSSTPTIVIVDRQGIVRLYHPGRMTEAELDDQIGRLVAAR